MTDQSKLCGRLVFTSAPNGPHCVMPLNHEGRCVMLACANPGCTDYDGHSGNCRPEPVNHSKLTYVFLPRGMVKVDCVGCGWEGTPMSASRFDPAEAIAAAITKHPRCTPLLKTIVLKTGERVTVDARHQGVYVLIDNHRTQVCAETVADCLDTFAAQFKTLAIELEQMAHAHRGGSKP